MGDDGPGRGVMRGGSLTRVEACRGTQGHPGSRDGDFVGRSEGMMRHDEDVHEVVPNGTLEVEG